MVPTGLMLGGENVALLLAGLNKNYPDLYHARLGISFSSV